MVAHGTIALLPRPLRPAVAAAPVEIAILEVLNDPGWMLLAGDGEGEVAEVENRGGGIVGHGDGEEVKCDSA